MNLLPEYENIVVGSSLAALLFAMKNDYSIFFAEERRPFRFDYFKPDIDLSFLQMRGQTKSLTTIGKQKIIGITC